MMVLPTIKQTILVKNPHTDKEVDVMPLFDFLNRYQRETKSDSSTAAFAQPILNGIRHISTCTACDVDTDATTVVQVGLWSLIDVLEKMNVKESATASLSRQMSTN